MSEHDELAKSLEFKENPEPRCACVLLLDTSSSMRGEPIAALNEGLRDFKTSLDDDPQARQRVEVAVVTFDDEVKVVQDFVTVDDFQPVDLTTQGYTYMGTAIEKALDMLQTRKQDYDRYKVQRFRPWIIMITDGEPQEEDPCIIEQAGARIRDYEQSGRVIFYPVGVEGADMELLSRISVRPPVRLTSLDFKTLFRWLSRSMQEASKGQEPLPPPDWKEE